MPISERLRVLLGILFLVLLVGVGVDAVVQAERSQVAQTIDDELVPARAEVTLLLTALLDQETGQRGYLLTGDEAFLEPFERGRESSEASLERLRRLVADDRATEAALARVRSRVNTWQQLAADFEIVTKRQGRDEIAAALVTSGTGRRLFDLVRTELDGLDHLLEAELDARHAEQSRLRDRHNQLRWTALVVALVLLGGTGVLFTRWVNRPLARLSTAVRSTAAGALHQPILPVGPPELAGLAEDVEAMRRRLLAELDDAARARAALADRGMIVVTLRDELGPTDVELPSGLAVAGRFRPAKGMVAGDWYDVVRLDDDRVAVALIDVSGHGAEVATFALRTKTLATAAITMHGPGAALTWLASHLGDTGELFLTGAIIELHVPTGQFLYASAGHPPLLLAGITSIRELPPTGPLLGPLPGDWTTESGRLEPGGVLVVYSDGLIEPRNRAGDMFGPARLRRVIREHQLDGVQAVADAAVQAVEDFAAVEGTDDITLCVLGR